MKKYKIEGSYTLGDNVVRKYAGEILIRGREVVGRIEQECPGCVLHKIKGFVDFIDGRNVITVTKFPVGKRFSANSNLEFQVDKKGANVAGEYSGVWKIPSPARGHKLSNEYQNENMRVWLNESEREKNPVKIVLRN